MQTIATSSSSFASAGSRVLRSLERRHWINQRAPMKHDADDQPKEKPAVDKMVHASPGVS